MNIRNNKGITLITLLITIIILVILASVTVTIGLNITETAELENVQTYLLLIQSKCKIMAEKYAIGEITEAELYGTKIPDGEDYAGWYLLDSEDLYEMGLEDLDVDDGYYVDYDNSDVAYAKGIEYEGKTYTKLSDFGSTSSTSSESVEE